MRLSTLGSVQIRFKISITIAAFLVALAPRASWADTPDQFAIRIFSATSCQPCRVLHSSLKKNNQKSGIKIEFKGSKLNIPIKTYDESGDLEKYPSLGWDGVSVPAIVIVKNGKVFARVTPKDLWEDGARELSAQEIESAIKTALVRADLAQRAEIDEAAKYCEAILRLHALGIRAISDAPAVSGGSVDTGESCPKQEPISVGNLGDLVPSRYGLSLDEGKLFSSAGASCASKAHFIPDNIKGVTKPFTAEAAQLNVAQLAGKRLVSLGEGDVRIVEYLNARQADAYAIDLDGKYVSKEGPIFQNNPEKYIHGDATQFSVLPVSEPGYDYILSSLLMCDLDYDLMEKSILDGLKALRMGGSERHMFNRIEDKIHPDSKEYKQMLAHIRESVKDESFDIEIYNAKVQLDYHDKPQQQLLIIKKIPKKIAP